jgi:HEAT repeat protein
LKAYRSGFLRERHEREQVQKLMGLLKKEFGGKTEDVRLIVDVTVNTQIDVIVYKDGKFVILEFKDVDGDIVVDLSGTKRMKKRVREKEIELRGNPLQQTTWQRNELMKLVWVDTLNRDESLTHGGVEYEEFGHSFGAWVVGNPGTDFTFTGREPKEIRWFAALPLDHVARSLRFEMSDRTLLTEKEFTSLIERLNAKETSWDNWIELGALVTEEGDTEPPRIGSIDESLLSQKVEDVTTALDQILELDLHGYLQEVLNATTSQHSAIRRKALEVLLAWNPRQLTSVVIHFLKDSDRSLADSALELMSRMPCPQATGELGEFLWSSDRNTVIRALRALGTTGSREACMVVLDFAKNNSFREGSRESNPWRTVVSVLGQLRCSEAFPLLMAMIQRIEKEESNEREYARDILKEEIIGSLGKIGDDRALPFLLEALQRCQDHDLIAPIRALGDVGSEQSVERLLPFLECDDNWVKNETAKALGKIRSEKALEPLAKYFVEGPEEKGLLAVRMPVMEALIATDPEGTEAYMINQLKTRKLDDDVIKRILRLLSQVATEASVDVLFSFAGLENHYVEASWALGERIRTEDVFSRAEGLLESENEFERASGVHIMSSTWGKDLLTQLKQHEKDPGRFVRRAVVDMYFIADNETSRKRLLGMVRDEDSYVRTTVYHAHFSKPRSVLNECFICYGDSCFRARHVILVEGAILSELTNPKTTDFIDDDPYEEDFNLLVIDVNGIDRVSVIGNGETGLFVSVSTEKGEQDWLIVCDDSYPLDPNRRVRDFVTELRRLTQRDTLVTKQTDRDKETISLLLSTMAEARTNASGR